MAGGLTITGTCSKCGGESTRARPCKPCRNAYLKKWYAANPESKSEAQLRYQASNREKVAGWIKAYKARHPERLKAQRAAYKQRPEVKMRSRLRANLSRARVGGYGNGILEVTEFDFQRMLDGQHGLCATCAQAKPLTIDHIVPVSKGGTNDLGNLQLLCRPCNTSKMTKIFSGIGYRIALSGVT